MKEKDALDYAEGEVEYNKTNIEYCLKGEELIIGINDKESDE